MLISLRNIKKSYGEQVVLAGVNLDIVRGAKIGLVGGNGAGKTTLANIITGNLAYDAGTIITSSETFNIGYLRQAESELELFFDIINNKDRSGDFKRITSHLGMKKVQKWSSERLRNLSGGEKTKLALAKIWSLNPDLIVLDEPTNHLDFQGIKYLIAELNNYKGTAIVISHDRYFLDQTVASVAEVEKGFIKVFSGNYTSYRETKEKEYGDNLHLYISQQKEQRKIENTITQLKTWSDKAHRESRQKGSGMMGGKEYYRKKAKRRDKAVKSQIKRLEKIEQDSIERPEQEPQIKINLNAFEKGGRRLLVVDSISKAYGNLVLFKNSSFYINRGEKLGVFGPNGCGKTTLIKAILGQETLDAGSIDISSTARIAYVGQELPQDERESIKDLVKDWPIVEQKNIFQLLISLGLDYVQLNVPMDKLSRGERMKIAIGLAIRGEYDLLILDEPTNHLDLYSREALEKSLLQYQGTLLIISHDHYLLNRVCKQMLVFEKQEIKRIEGNLENYLARKEIKKDTDTNKANNADELLLLENEISRVLSELSLCKPTEDRYVLLDQEYIELIKRRKELSNRLT